MDQPIIVRAPKRGKANSLQSLIENLVRDINPSATKKRNLIVNDVPPNLVLKCNIHLLRLLISRIILLIMDVTKNNTISISAKTYSDVVLMHFKETNLRHLAFVFDGLKQMHKEAEQMGGFLGVTNHQGYSTTIALTFVNLKRSSNNNKKDLAKTVSAIQQIPGSKT